MEIELNALDRFYMNFLSAQKRTLEITAPNNMRTTAIPTLGTKQDIDLNALVRGLQDIISGEARLSDEIKYGLIVLVLLVLIGLGFAITACCK